MTDQERNQILKMINAGTISAEEGLRLMQALGEDPVEKKVEVIQPAEETKSKSQADPKVASSIERMRRFWHIPLWIGIGLTVLGGWLMYWVMQKTGMGFWFFCSWLPFVVGVIMIGGAWASRSARWIHVRVQRKPENAGPKNISLSFPLPLRLTSWAVRTFGHNLRDLEKTAVDEVVQALEQTVNSDAPLYVEVDDAEDDDVEHVQVYIG